MYIYKLRLSLSLAQTKQRISLFMELFFLLVLVSSLHSHTRTHTALSLMKTFLPLLRLGDKRMCRNGFIWSQRVFCRCNKNRWAEAHTKKRKKNVWHRESYRSWIVRVVRRFLLIAQCGGRILKRCAENIRRGRQQGSWSKRRYCFSLTMQLVLELPGSQNEPCTHAGKYVSV